MRKNECKRTRMVAGSIAPVVPGGPQKIDPRRIFAQFELPVTTTTQMPKGRREREKPEVRRGGDPTTNGLPKVKGADFPTVHRSTPKVSYEGPPPRTRGGV